MMIPSRVGQLSRARRAANVTFQRRGFFGIQSPVASSSGGVYVTKYEITKPGKEGHEWDDFLLAHPEREALATSGKEVPLFLKYLKVVADKEGSAVMKLEALKKSKHQLYIIIF